MTRRAANPCPALGGGGWSAYFGDFFDIGGDDFKISCLGEFFEQSRWKKFLFSGSWYAHQLMFFYSFSPNFFVDLFFCSPPLLSQILVKIALTLKNFSHLASYTPQNIFMHPHSISPLPVSRLLGYGGKIIGDAGQKSKLLGGWRSNIGGCIPRIPPGLAALMIRLFIGV